MCIVELLEGCFGFPFKSLAAPCAATLEGHLSSVRVESLQVDEPKVAKQETVKARE
jgi:hypothetical protein